MSKDAQLLRAMGMGPDERPELWQFETAMHFCEGDFEEAGETYIGPSLGLDLDPSEWTVEHDAAFARVVWPWWVSLNQKKTCRKSIVNGVRVLLLLGDPWDSSPNPGPTMCQAIYSVLCGEQTE